MIIRVDCSKDNFPKSGLTMFYGWENTSGSAFIEGKNLKKCTQQKKDDLKVLYLTLLQLNKYALRVINFKKIA